MKKNIIKQEIKEIAIILSEGACKNCNCDENDMYNCKLLYDAELLYKAGYRKINKTNYKLSLDEFLIILRNTCTYIPNLDYESISFMIKQETEDYIKTEHFKVNLFIEEFTKNCIDNDNNEESIQYFVNEMKRIIYELTEKYEKEISKITSYHSD